MSLRGRNYVVVGLLLIFIVSPIVAAEESRYSVTMPGGPPLSFLQPTAWSVETEEEGPSVTVRLLPTSGPDFVMLMTIFPFQPDSPIASPEGLRTAVLEVGQQKLPGALQDSIELMEVRGSEAFGHLYHLTDRNPEQGPGDYREAHQGMMLLAPYVASVTILTHSDDTSSVEGAFELLKSIEVESEP
jgi:hypothetical protein